MEQRQWWVQIKADPTLLVDVASFTTKLCKFKRKTKSKDVFDETLYIINFIMLPFSKYLLRICSYVRQFCYIILQYKLAASFIEHTSH